MAPFQCRACPQAFPHREILDEHETNTGHYRNRYPCLMCPAAFFTQDEAEDHMDVFGHFEYKCESCGIHFRESGHLKMVRITLLGHSDRTVLLTTIWHLESNVHKPLIHQCPFCPEMFGTPSAVAHHLESNCCPIATWEDVEHLHGILRSIDKEGVFTLPKPVNRPLPRYVSHNDFHKCLICDRVFKRENGLMAHLQSPVHRPIIYRCIHDREHCDKKGFVTLAAFYNHLESGACGRLDFEFVEEFHNILADAAMVQRPLYFADLAV
ncbi:hypothetical protein N7541_011563 [Penicillium brevicompactum]|uniref:C2H2-type domain-containing protein n=1 Tax=Penicillium brevicompactum TaxID=5074 RepID=A0A9W9UG09_PENBR|nr:uncharacterized protein N7506_008722 [Penicillium brevicompactum]KAJ5325620.1 hypothetical protein N7506_008722 [Penicillium brevicompactum]KAJ5339607.1 hypothetical protein N7452_006335 [Penicillium brevicompactum]KAJ5342439.1 hypothetical protein N7541_011563 [Penicillium brevicompactum]